MNRDAKPLTINLTTAIASYTISLFVSFFLVPHIIDVIGIEASGFISLANSFVSYASLLSIALNSMASRFITIQLKQGNIQKASAYYNSVLFANVFLAAILFLVFGACIVAIHKIINIPSMMVIDVQLLFLFIAINFIVLIFSSTLSVSTFATNRLYLSNLRTVEANAIRALLLWILFSLFAGRMYFVGLASVLSSVYLLVRHFRYRKKLLEEIKTSRKFFDIELVKEVAVSGVWNAITRLGQILQHGLDTLIVNIFLGPVAMGVISLSKTIPQAIIGLVGALAAVFVPDITFDYAAGNIEGIVKTVKRSMKIMSTICSIPIVVVLVSGEQFYRLWVPTQNSTELHLLSTLALSCLVVSAGINVIYNVFTVVNRLKLNSITVVINGFLSTVLVVLLLKTTDLGLVAVVLVGELIGLIRVLAFVVPYGAKCLGQRWFTFYPDALKPLVSAVACFIIGRLIMDRITINGWTEYIVVAFIVAMITLIVNVLVVLNRDDRKALVETVRRIVIKQSA